jgi:hypothetical protein
MLVLMMGAPVTHAAEPASDELQQRIKAAFLYKFAAFVEWPDDAFPSPDSPLVLGVAGADSIGRELSRSFAGRMAAGRTVKIRTVTRGAEARSCCQILYIGTHDRAWTDEMLAQARGHPVLTVTDLDAAHPPGSVINFLTVEDRVRFDISRSAAERNGLQLRSQLLGVARRVEPAP